MLLLALGLSVVDTSLLLTYCSQNQGTKDVDRDLVDRQRSGTILTTGHGTGY